jgi:effector-binding domain-containing protein
MISEPKLVDRAAQHYLSIRTQVSVQEFGSGIIPQLHSEVMASMQKRGIAPAGAPFIRYDVISMPGRLDVEMGWPVASPAPDDGRVKSGSLPAGRYATVLYTGPYDGLMEANRVLIEWAKAQGIVWDSWPTAEGDAFGARFESYITDPGEQPDPSKWETEVLIRLADQQPRK